MRELDAFLGPDARLEALYGALPAVGALTLHSLRLATAGPMLYLRADLADYPSFAPVEWAEAGCDRFQLNFEFLAVSDFVVADLRMPAEIIITGNEEEGASPGRVRFRLSGDGVNVRFGAYGQVRTGAYSAYRHAEAINEDAGSAAHRYLGRSYGIKYRTIPEPWVEVFHERV